MSCLLEMWSRDDESWLTRDGNEWMGAPPQRDCCHLYHSLVVVLVIMVSMATMLLFPGSCRGDGGDDGDNAGGNGNNISCCLPVVVEEMGVMMVIVAVAVPTVAARIGNGYSGSGINHAKIKYVI
ncbi:hypothetical protein M0R45_007719 [Rubus argutus]|uniref:Uncharacterized protein n=1 Tax=Rubus argutus TaxID=59490 RepID=A0AAW1Y1H9_RUBAR